MSFVNFALLADNEVFHVLGFDEDNAIAEKWIAALRSNVELVDTAGYPKIRKGYLYGNGNFYGPEDTEMANPLPKSEPNYDDTIVFAGVIDNEVIGLMSFVAEDTDPEVYEMAKAGMLSNPTYAEAPTDVVPGWFFQNGTFVDPEA